MTSEQSLLHNKSMLVLKRNIILFVLFCSSVSYGLNDAHLTNFLKACGYGTLIGAGAGAASLAFTDDPGSKMMNIAKGASIGLYVGIGIGIYINSQDGQRQDQDVTMIYPTSSAGKIDGASFAILRTF